MEKLELCSVLLAIFVSIPLGFYIIPFVLAKYIVVGVSICILMPVLILGYYIYDWNNGYNVKGKV